jgi:hypothetical protein
MKRLLVLLIWPWFTASAQADLTIQDGGFHITVAYRGQAASVSKDPFLVTGTGGDAQSARVIAEQKAVERHADFERSLDALIGKALVAPPIVHAPVVQPVCTPAPHFAHPPVPRQVYPDAVLPYPLPLGVSVDRWIVPNSRFYSTDGRLWYYDLRRKVWIDP